MTNMKLQPIYSLIRWLFLSKFNKEDAPPPWIGLRCPDKNFMRLYNLEDVKTRPIETPKFGGCKWPIKTYQTMWRLRLIVSLVTHKKNTQPWQAKSPTWPCRSWSLSNNQSNYITHLANQFGTIFVSYAQSINNFEFITLVILLVKISNFYCCEIQLNQINHSELMARLLDLIHWT